VPLAEIHVWQPVDPVRVLALAELMIAGAEFAPLQLDVDGRLCNGDERLAAARAAGFSHVPTVTRALMTVDSALGSKQKPTRKIARRARI
jgi:hypothetical protein